jgi:copper(I)-binding protein
LCCAAVVNSIRKDQTMRSFVLLIAALVGLAAMPASARDYKAGTLTITDPWSRATPKGASVGAGYLKIVKHRHDG